MKNRIYILLLTFVIGLTSCENFFSPEANDVIPEKESFEKRSEIYSAFIGMGAIFQEVATQWLLLSELRGDMMEPTVSAPEELWQIYRYEPSTENKLVKPDVFYRVILYANDFIRHLVDKKNENSEIVEDNVYQMMISQALCYRNWCYLTIGKIYGEAAWHDYAFSDAIDASQIPVLKFDELLPELTNSMLNGVGGIGGLHNEANWAEDILQNGDYAWNRVVVDCNNLMAELCLWQGEYQQALEYIRNILSIGDVNKYKVSSLYGNGEWKKMISSEIGNAIHERQTVIPFSATENQFCTFQKWLQFAQLIPTSSTIKRFEKQERVDGNIGDRYRGENVTYKVNGENAFIAKYSIATQNADAPVIIYRAADIHFMLVEVLNRLGFCEEALTVLNDGLKSYWNGSAFKPPFDNPLFPVAMRENIGIRGRVALKPVRPEIFDVPTATPEQKAFALDSLMVEEIAMEMAYEGKRWFALMRLAKYWSKPEMLAVPVAEKFVGEKERYKNYLMNPENWYLKVKHN